MMDKTYQPSDIEQKWYQQWEAKGYFKPSGSGAPYCIMIPPPNVTGSLHMGHAFQDSIMDALIRYKRMQQHNTLWQVGTDHAGIATQMVVERRLAAQDQTRHQLGRDGFIEKVWEWKEESGGTISRQLRRMGASADWSRERFTMDQGLSSSVLEVFVRLHEQGLIYRGKRLVNWDPKLCTAISDLEVENHEKQGKLWYFRYPLADGQKTQDNKSYLVVATTRPETMLGDSAVGVNPNDERYKELIGKEVILPLVNRRIPIIADRYVDPEFGTGCVKLTPAHDFNDYEVGKRHQLPLINIFNETAHVLDKTQVYGWENQQLEDLEEALPAAYQGLERFAARRAVVADMEAQDLLEKIDDHGLKVPVGDRSGEVIEPLLTDQWYVRVAPLAEQAVKAVEDGEIQFVPKQYENMYFAWMRDIQDWCISRQLWWGHRIPAWYDAQGNIYVARNEAEARSKYELGDDVALHQDDDVLDTWFSSALWTFSTLGWPEQTPELKTFHPTDVLVTGFDIIFFWVARMIMMTMHFIKDENGKPQVPFKTVYVTGLIRDESGQKMSKSKGNVLDPLDMIDGIDGSSLLEKRTSNLMQDKLAAKIAKQTKKEFPDGIQAYGTDALRFTLTSLASTGRDINWDMKRLEGYRNFCNKIWNASRYAMSHAEDYDATAPRQFSTADQWINSALQQAISDVTQALDTYRFDLASKALYEFIWHEFCDWYLELSKPILNAVTGEQADDCSVEAQALAMGARHTLLHVLESTLRLAHPFIPFISEEIWQMLAPLCSNEESSKADQETSIMLQSYPQADQQLHNQQATDDVAWLKTVVTALRNIRGEMNIAPSKAIPALLHKGNAADQQRLLENAQYLRSLAKLESIRFLEPEEELPACSVQIAGSLEILVPIKGLIDVAAEKKRLAQEVERAEKECQRLSAKLGNANFVERAPAAVVGEEKQKLKLAEQNLDLLKEKNLELDGLA